MGVRGAVAVVLYWVSLKGAYNMCAERTMLWAHIYQVLRFRDDSR